MQNILETEIRTIARTAQGNAILLRPLGKDTVIPIYIGPSETQAILIGLGNIKTERPMAHDLLLTLLNRLGFKLIRVEICDLKEDIFYARLVIATANSSMESPGGMPLNLDARPSDALSLAVRSACPIFIAPPVMEDAGIPVGIIIEDIQETIEPGAFPVFEISRDKCSSFSGILNRFSDEMSSSSAKPGEEEKPESLGEELEEALAEENYERAAQIRDILRFLYKKA